MIYIWFNVLFADGKVYRNKLSLGLGYMQRKSWQLSRLTLHLGTLDSPGANACVRSVLGVYRKLPHSVFCAGTYRDTKPSMMLSDE